MLGHEGVGIVEKVSVADTPTGMSDAIQHIAVGDRVTWTVAASGCGAHPCAFCRDYRLPQKCTHVLKYGHARFDVSESNCVSSHGGTSAARPWLGLAGTYATHIVLRAGTGIVKLPADPSALPDAVAAPANCALATMVNAVSSIPPMARRVWIQGAGLLGIYGAALLRESGVHDVIVTDVAPHRVALARKFGASAGVVVAPGEEADVAASKALDASGSGPAQFDAVVEVCGVAGVVAAGLRALRPGGCYVLVGMVHPDSKLAITGEAIIRKCATIVGVHNYAPQHLHRGVQFLTASLNKYPYSELVSSPQPLDSLAGPCLELARCGQVSRVLLVP